MRDGGPVNREQLRELLWPERGEDQARHSLRQALLVLRRDGFGGQDALVSRDGMLKLLAERVACDLWELRALIAADSNASWQAIMALYSGPLLNGFPPVSPEVTRNNVSRSRSGCWRSIRCVRTRIAG